MPAVSISCCVDVPTEAEELVRYGLEELLRGLGLAPEWTHRESAQLAVVFRKDGGGASVHESPGASLVLFVTQRALEALHRPESPDLDRIGWIDIGGERWPLPAGGTEPGDLIASAAWWLAGLQEHATTERDPHGRFPYSASLQSRLGNAPGGPLRPAVDAYRQWLADALGQRGIDVPGRTWGGASWAVALTHDLDAVRTHRLRAFVGDIARGHLGAGIRRAFGPDPRWQSVLALRSLAERHGVQSTWFVKPGAWAPEDVAQPLDDRYCSFLRDLEREAHEVGWHPGYGAHDHRDRLATERSRFERALGHPPVLARTHFLRWTEPLTPRLLNAEGVRLDSTLGFSHHEGFRRGTAHPFRVYDLGAGRVTDLWEAPLAVMDTTLAQHRGLSGDALADALADVLAAARAARGCAVVLWHSDMGEGRAWRDRLHALDHSVGQSLREGAAVGPVGRLLSAWCGDL